jgi:hypothetical protein
MLRNTLSVVACFILAGCSTLTIKTDYDRQASFSAYRTFNFLPKRERKETALEGLTDGLVTKRIDRAVKGELIDKGFVLDSVPNADMLVAYHVVLRDTTEIETYGYNYPVWGFFDVHRYTQGTLVIDMVDGQSKETIWRGMATDVVRGDVDRSQERINKVVAKILADFPPK